ncbi:MAG TPA: CBS domain-containing protein [Steroidobacteraceae bacterium]|nr:CBS domain-containing protein [Steroidobacteraceae bacterium]
MNLGNLCRRHFVTAQTGAPVSEVATLMRDEHVGAVIVTDAARDQQRVLGIITDRDIVRAQLSRTADLSRLSAGEVMTHNPLVLSELDSVGSAIADLRARGVRRAPVVAEDGSLVGLLSADDLLVHLARKLGALAGIVERQIRREGG